MKVIYIAALAFLISACSTLEITTGNALPAVEKTHSITLFSLANYTDTPQAGMRAANLLEGALLSKGYTVVNAVSFGNKALRDQIKTASENRSDYLITGGVSEWRYKTGIDGEPAVSIHVKMIEVASGKTVWNATASSNDWGNASIGTTAQTMIETMLQTP